MDMSKIAHYYSINGKKEYISSDDLWDKYEEEFWLQLDAEIEILETKLKDLKKIREKRNEIQNSSSTLHL